MQILLLCFLAVTSCFVPLADAAATTSACAKKCAKASVLRRRPGKRWATDEGRLIDDLLHRSDYFKFVRPVKNASDQVRVGFGLSLTMIMDMDEKNQVLITNVWLTTKWTDNRLYWNTSDYNGLKKIRLPAAHFWVPDIVLYNNADDYTSGYMDINLMIDSDGGVNWSPPARLQSSCKIDISYFPYDTQLCHLKFGSWTYDTAQLDMYVMDANADLSYYVKSGEWQLIRAWLERNEIAYPIDSSRYTDVTLYICLKRRILYYVLNILFPCICLNVLSLLTFFVPPAAGEKVSLGITVLLSYSVFMLLVANTMPPTSDFIPLIGIYLTFSMGLTSISVILTICILKIYHGGPTRKPVPPWLSRLIRLTCVQRCCVERPPLHRHRLPTMPLETLDGRVPNDCTESAQDESFLPFVISAPSPPASKSRPSSCDDPWVRQNGLEACPNIAALRCQRPLADIRHDVRLLASRCEDEMSAQELEADWHHVARVFDRLFFLVFLIGTLLITFTLLYVVPFTQASEEKQCTDRYQAMRSFAHK